MKIVFINHHHHHQRSLSTTMSSSSNLFEESFQSSQNETRFDPAIHLAYQPPKQRLTMAELNLTQNKAPSRVGCTSPFPLASLEGVKALRADILQKRVLDNHMMQSGIAGPHAQLRGMAPEAAQFVQQFWTNPATLAAVSEAAGEDLVPVFDLELGHTNIQIPDGSDRRTYLDSLPVDPFAKDKNKKLAAPTKDEKEPQVVVGYHRDAYPWVCVLMLSDVSDMVGGETEIRRGDGTTIKAMGPGIGNCVMMQGGYIEHCALPARGASERITMVTSFRPRNKVYRDLTDLRNIRDCSNLYELHDQFLRSRLDIVQETLNSYRNNLAHRRHDVEVAYGKRGGIKREIVDKREIQGLIDFFTNTLTNAMEQMPDLKNAHEERLSKL